MSAMIMMHTDEVKLRADEITRFAKDERIRLYRMVTLVNSLSEVWQGQAQDALVLRFDQYRREIEHTIEAVEEYAKNLKIAADSFADIELGAMSSFGNVRDTIEGWMRM